MSLGGTRNLYGELASPRKNQNRRYQSQPSLTQPLSNDVVYLDERRVPVPPYLRVSVATSTSQQDVDNHHSQHPTQTPTAGASAGAEEADAAAGGQSSILRRVSSLGIMSRVASSPAISDHQHHLLLSGGDPSSAYTSGTSPALSGSRRTWNGGPSRNRNAYGATSNNESRGVIQPSWRLRDPMKTVGVGLVMALNVGTDPPDVVRSHPCAKLQCWMDPTSVSRAKAKEMIGARLEAQYARWQQQRAVWPLKYRRALDPTVEDVRALCLWLRRHARHERILLHYNGHGVPRPTPDGEIWVFDKNHTEYIPVSVSDVKQWAGKPTIVVLDCSSAGTLIPFLTARPVETPISTPPRTGTPTPDPLSSSTQQPNQQQQFEIEDPPVMDMDTAASLWVKDTIVLCPTSDQEWLPTNPEYPADIFTSCLTTPIPMALRWFIQHNRISMGNLPPDAVDSIPGHANDRRTPLGELNWIFTAVTDTILWNVLPKPLFQRLFRQDLLVASVFRNFLLADRILRSLNCTPQSYPPLPRGVADHPLWLAWDLACETCLFGLIKDGLLGSPAVPAGVTPATGNKSKGNDMNPPNNTNQKSNNDYAGEAETEDGQPSSAAATADSSNKASPGRQSNHATAVKTGPASSISSPFFSEQLTAFEVWLEYAAMHKGNIDRLEAPEQLPVVLQVLLSQVHRVRALHLLQRFLELGPWAVNLSLSVGIFPYVKKLLQSAEYKSVMVNIWSRIIAFDISCQVDLVKENALAYFIQPLAQWSNPPSSTQPSTNLHDIAKQRTLAAFVLAATCYKYPVAQTECLRQNLHGSCMTLLSAQIKLEQQQLQQQLEEPTSRRVSNDASRFELLAPIAKEWICFCLGNLVQAYPPAQAESYNADVHLCLLSLQQDADQNVRAAATYALGCLFLDAPAMPSVSSSSSLGGDPSSSTPSARGPTASPASVVPHAFLGSPTLLNLGPQAFVNPSSGIAPPPSFQSGVGMGQIASMGVQQQLFIPHQISSAAMALPPGHPNGGSTVPPAMAGAGTGRAMGVTSQQQVFPIGPIGGPPSMGEPVRLSSHTLQQQQQHGVAQGGPKAPGLSARIGPGGPMLYSTTHPPSFGAGQPPSGAPPLVHPAQQGAVLYPQGPTVAASVGPRGSQFGPMISGGGPLPILTSPNHPPVGMPIIGSPLGGGHTGTPQGLMTPIGGFQHIEPQQLTRRRPTVYEDRRRLEFDLKVVASMIKVLFDGSPLVRYEVIMSMSNFVEKYLQAVLVVAEDSSRVADADGRSENDQFQQRKNPSKERSTEDRMRVVPLPRGVNQIIMERIEECWVALRKVQHEDPHPKVSEASNTIVRVVHETLLDMRMEREMKRAKERKEGGLSGIQEEGEPDIMERIRSEQHLHVSSPDSGPITSRAAPNTDGRAHRVPNVNLYPLRRSASETAGRHFPVSPESGSSSTPSIPIPGRDPLARVTAENLLPKSQLYEWKKSLFRSDYDDIEQEDVEDQDPLNPFGAARSYQNRRNATIKEGGRKLAEHFVGLKPKIVSQKKGLEKILDIEEDEDAEERDSGLKSELKLREKRILRITDTEDVKTTSMLKFHSFENALVACCDADSVYFWDYEKGQRGSSFKNGNPSGSRMTSALWINESTSSLFLIGCDDGSARIWSGIIRDNGDVARQSPTLASAFFAAPDMKAGQRSKSGLICEWQQRSGTLICGGNSSYLRCWNMNAEMCSTVLDAESEGCITTLTTAWDEESSVSPTASRGMGPDVIVAGHSDGTLKVFDIRMSRVAATRSNNDRDGRRRSQNTSFAEHPGWIVDTSFTSYGGRNEIVSGSVAGDIRAWDLRTSRSIRAVQVQRSPMTALAIHRKVPIAVSGSHAQFIKILTLEGETLQVVRFHEEQAGHRIGPVSCLEFHKQKLLLATGSSNSLVSIYQPRQSLK